MKKQKQLLIKISPEILKTYKTLCEKMGYNMSQRIRNFIETEIKNLHYKHQNKELLCIMIYYPQSIMMWLF